MPEEVWKAIYFHYLPIGVEADAPPSRQQLGAAAVTWAAVSLADKLDSVVGMFTAGERPTGSRDPLGLRRQAQGAVKILADLPELTGLDARLTLGPLLARAAEPFGGYGDAAAPLFTFMADRLAYLLEQRGFDVRSVRAVMHGGVEQRQPARGAAQARGAGADERVGGAARRGDAAQAREEHHEGRRGAAARLAALDARADASRRSRRSWRELDGRARRRSGPRRRAATTARRSPAIAALQPVVAKFFDDVLVMAEDEALRAARLALVATLRDLILEIADISEIAAGVTRAMQGADSGCTKIAAG